MRRLWLGLAMAVVAAAGRADAGAWQITDTVSALDGKHSYIATVSADDPVLGKRHIAKRPLLGVSCDFNGLHLFISWPAAVQEPFDGLVEFQWRLIPGGPAEKGSWLESNEGLFIGGQPALALGRRWRAGQALVVRVPDYYGGQEATFQIAGLDAVISHIEATGCG